MINLPELMRITKESEITSLTGTLTTTSDVIPVADINALSPAPNLALIFDRTGSRAELVKYTGKAGNALVGLTRGYEGRTGVYAWSQWTDEQGRAMVNVVTGLSSAHIDKLIDSVEILKAELEALQGIIDSGHTGFASTEDIQELMDVVEAALAAIGGNIASQISSLREDVNGLKNQGGFVGSFAMVADLPATTDGFEFTVFPNDFATVQANEDVGGLPSRFIIHSIDDGNILWMHSIDYQTDITGKMDLVPSPIEGNFITMDSNGNAVDSGITVKDLELMMPAASATVRGGIRLVQISAGVWDIRTD